MQGFIVDHLVVKFPYFMKTRRLIAVFTEVRHCTLLLTYFSPHPKPSFL
jgi:hypothetical protein